MGLVFLFNPFLYRSRGIIFVILSSLMLFSQVQAQMPLSAKEIWTYGRGVIQYFIWLEQSLVFATNDEFWSLALPLDQNASPQKELPFTSPVSISADGLFAITNEVTDLQLWDTQTKSLITTIPISSPFVSQEIVWQPNGARFAIITNNNAVDAERSKIDLWDRSTGRLIRTIGAYSDTIAGLSWHPDQNIIAVQFTTGRILIENAANGQRLYTLQADEGVSADVMWSPDGQFLAVTSNTLQPIKLWRTDTFEPVTRDNLPQFIVALAWNEASTRLAGTLATGDIGIWDIETGELTLLTTHHFRDAAAQSLQWQGNMLAALDDRGHLQIWHVPTRNLLWDSVQHEFHNFLQALAVSPDGRKIALSHRLENNVIVLDTDTGRPLTILEAPRPLEIISAMAWDASSAYLAASDGDNDLFIWNTQPDAPAAPLQVDHVTYFSWSPDGRLAATSIAQRQDELRIIQGQTGEELVSYPLTGLVRAIWSPDGRFIALYRSRPPQDDMTIPLAYIDIWDIEADTMTTIQFPVLDEARMPRVPSEFFFWLPDSSGLMGFANGTDLWRWQFNDGEASVIASLYPRESRLSQSIQIFSAHLTTYPYLLTLTESGLHIYDAATVEMLFEKTNLAREPFLFDWGKGDRLFVSDGVLRAYRMTPLKTR